MAYQLAQTGETQELNIEHSLSIYKASDFSFALHEASESEQGLTIRIAHDVCLDTAIIQVILFYAKLATNKELPFKVCLKDRSLFDDLQLIGVQPSMMELEA